MQTLTSPNYRRAPAARSGWNIRFALILLPLASAAITGCSRHEPAARQEIVFYCAAGMREAADALIATFESNRSAKVVANYSGSGRLLGQLAAGAQCDVFMPGDEFYVSRAVELGLVPSNQSALVAYYIPVILVQNGNPKKISSLADFTQPGLRIGIGDERLCAVGITSLALFASNGIAFVSIETNVVLRSGTVNELGVAISSRTIDATIIWDAIAHQFATSGDSIAIPRERTISVPVPAVVTKASRNSDAAAQFVTFLASQEAKAVLRSFNYTVELP